MTKFPKLRTLTGDEKSQIFFGEHTFPIRFFPPELCPTRENAKIEKFFFAKRNFSFFALFFCLFLNSTQPEFWCYKREFMNCKHPIMVSLAFFIPTIPILIRKWGQNTSEGRQDQHIPKFPHFHPSFLALFLHFFSVMCCKWIF